MLKYITRDNNLRRIPVISKRGSLQIPLFFFWAINHLNIEINAYGCTVFLYLVMSAQDEVSIVVKCLRLGAADYLVKPLRTNELLNLWTHMWRRRRMVFRADLVTWFII